MSRAVHRTVIGVVVLLLILMAVLLFRGPRFTVGSTTIYVNDTAGADVNVPDTPVRCGAVLTVGWPSDHADFDETTSWSTSTHYSLPGRIGVEDARAIRYGLDQECNERRDTYIGFLIILAVPTCLLGALAISRPPQPRVEVAAQGDAHGPDQVQPGQPGQDQDRGQRDDRRPPADAPPG